MYIPLSDDEHRFVQKVHPTRANGHWEHGRNSNPVATLPHAAVVCNHLMLFAERLEIKIPNYMLQQ